METTSEIAGGQLSAHPLVELVHEIANAKLSGAIRLQHERVKAVVYFDTGEVIFAVSNQRRHRVSECAREWQYVSSAQLTSVPAKPTDIEFGYALVESGILTTERLEDLFVRLTTEVLRELLLWPRGEWIFDARVRLAQSVGAHIALRPLLLEAVRKFPPEFAVKRLANPNRQVVTVPTAMNGLTLTSMEAFVLSRVETGVQLGALGGNVGLPEPDLMRSVYALVLGGFLHGSLWPAAFDEVHLNRAKALTAKSQRPATKVQSSNDRPAFQPAASSSIPPPEKKVAPEVAEAAAIADRRAADAFLYRVEEAKNFYEVLDLGRQASEDEVKRAYYTLARQFHPDRFHQDQGTSFHVGLQTAFAKVSQAYDNLRDEKLRAAHDRKLVAASSGTGAVDPMSNEQFSGTPSQQAEARFQAGVNALQKGDADQALMLCGQAAKMMPANARYRAAYGQALAQKPNKRHEAEAELKEAIKLDSRNATFMVILAEFYSEMGLNHRAIAEFRRALAIEPGNVIARRRLADLQI